METNEILVAIQAAANTIATPNWAVVLSVVAALGAVAVAIIVAIKQNKIAEKQNEIAERQAEIAEQQNKIALFKERYVVYSELYKFFTICSQIKKVWEESKPSFKDFGEKNKRIFLHVVEAVFVIKLEMNSETGDDGSSMETLITLLSQIHQSTYQITRAKFLFPDIEESDLEDLLESWTEFIAFLTIPNKPLNAADEKFVESCEYVKNTYLSIIENQLNLK